MRKTVALATALAAGALAAPASAQGLDEQVSATAASAESCFEGARDDSAVVTRRVLAEGASMVSADLFGAGEWSLAIYEVNGGRLVSGSDYRGGREVAAGFTAGGGELLLQACREQGSGAGARLEASVAELQNGPSDLPLQLVRVNVPDAEAEERLLALGLDLTEHGGPGYIDVVLHGLDDGATLREAGLAYDVVIPDLVEDSLDRIAADRRAARRGAPTGLPSGRTGTYRELLDYSTELQQLEEDNPKLVRYFTLKKRTYEDRPVEAIEIASRVNRNRTKDGRPVFLMMGAHHAREWPSAEHTIEFAYELVNGWDDGKKSIRRNLRRSRVILVPIVNPDGFSVSRGAPGALPGGRGGPDETANLVIPREYHRKNCRTDPPEEEPGGSCMQGGGGDTGLAHFGVDPNRNYGGFWGGPGASAEDTQPFGSLAQDYRGPGPFSEPETKNIRKLVSKRQVTTLITNHTFSNLLLRPPGLQSQGPPPDEPVYKRLGDSMAAENGYASQRSYQLYDTSGTTEDWTYYSTGGLGFTFEIGPNNFHPPFAEMVAEYDGTAAPGGDTGGNRAAYLKALRSNSKTSRHSVIAGRAPDGAVLTISKTFKTRTSPVIDGTGEEGPVQKFTDRLRSRLVVGQSGRFDWHVNPSTRPVVDPRRDLPQKRPGQPSDPVAFSGDPTGALPGGDAETDNPAFFNDHPFTVPGGQGIDNGTATTTVTWETPTSDWDMKVFRDGDGDGKSESEDDRELGSSADGTTNKEQTTIARPGLRPGKYVVRVTNFAATEPYEGEVTFGKTQSGPRLRHERWTLTCRPSADAPVSERRKVRVDRGDRAVIDLRNACG